jgi:hypothetical protein
VSPSETATQFAGAVGDWLRAAADATSSALLDCTPGPAYQGDTCGFTLSRVATAAQSVQGLLDSHSPAPSAFAAIPPLVRTAGASLAKAGGGTPGQAVTVALLDAADSDVRAAARALGVVLPTAFPVPTRPPSLGDTVTTTMGVTLAVTQYVDHFSSGNQFETPSSGFWAAISVKVCAGPEKLTISPSQFRAVEPDDTQVQDAIAVKEPALHVTTLQPHDCVAGWVSFDLASKPKAVVVTNSDARWAIP